MVENKKTASTNRTARGANNAALKANAVPEEGFNKASSMSTVGDSYSDPNSGRVTMAESSLVGGSPSSVKMNPRIYSPLFEQSNLQLPRDRRTLNAWARFHFETNPWVKNAITLHSTFPISKWNISCKDPKIEQECNDAMEDISFSTVLSGIASEMWKLGEAVPYGTWDEDNKRWSRFVIFNPDYIHITSNVLSSEPIITLQPDDQLTRIVNSSNASDMEIRKQLPPEIVNYIRNGQNIPLNNFYASHLKLLSAPYDLRGTSVIVAAFKDLMLYDILREAEYAQASDMINPVTLIKLGDPNGNWKPTNEDVRRMAVAWEEGVYDQNFKIVTHGAVTVEKIGNSGSIVDTASRIDRIEKNVLTALFSPMGVTHGEGPTYATSSIGLEVLKVRYNNFRYQIKDWVEQKVFLPMAKARGWIEHDGGQRKYIVPSVMWNKMNLRDLESYIATLIQLLGDGGGTGNVSVQTVFDSLDINYEDEQRRLRKERIDAEIKQRESVGLTQMSMKEMQSLTEDSDIPEPDMSQVDRGQEEGDMMGGEGGGLGDLGGGMGGGGGGSLDSAIDDALGGGGGLGEETPAPEAPME